MSRTSDSSATNILRPLPGDFRKNLHLGRWVSAAAVVVVLAVAIIVPFREQARWEGAADARQQALTEALAANLAELKTVSAAVSRLEGNLQAVQLAQGVQAGDIDRLRGRMDEAASAVELRRLETRVRDLEKLMGHQRKYIDRLKLFHEGDRPKGAT